MVGIAIQLVWFANKTLGLNSFSVYFSRFSVRTIALKKQQDKRQKQLRKHHEGAEESAFQSLTENNETALQQVQQDEQIYHEALEKISRTIHPFTLDSLQWQTQKRLLTNLAAPLQCLWNLAPTYGAQKAQQAIDTFEEQINSFA